MKIYVNLHYVQNVHAFIYARKPVTIYDFTTILSYLTFFNSYLPVLRIRIRIRRILMFLGLPDPDPLVRDMDPDPDPNPAPSISKQK